VKALGEARIPNADVKNTFRSKVVAIDVQLHPALVRRGRLVGPVAQLLAETNARVGAPTAVEGQFGKAPRVKSAPRIISVH